MTICVTFLFSQSRPEVRCGMDRLVHLLCSLLYLVVFNPEEQEWLLEQVKACERNQTHDRQQKKNRVGPDTEDVARDLNEHPQAILCGDAGLGLVAVAT
ncbi:hypothetical protein ACC691_26515 [Rhizobium johnstonii]|uniref:hypothetical protein n=1 Tax=Rhizobium johnstonii TaxID=3019933 RepID=UPI003F9BD36F